MGPLSLEVFEGASPTCRTAARHSNAETPLVNPRTPRLLAASSPYDNSEMHPVFDKKNVGDGGCRSFGTGTGGTTERAPPRAEL